MLFKKRFEEGDEEDKVIRNEQGDITFRFSNSADKQSFLTGLRRGIAQKEEGYRCGHCAAYPCFRGYNEETKVNSVACFQNVRSCREECPNYQIKEFSFDGKRLISNLVNGGVCMIDNSSVNYNQSCHIKAIKGSKGDLEFSVWSIL